MNKHGFTLLEVTLFFAVSGLLALVAFAGLGPRLRNVRFTDAVRSLESSTQRQLSDFQSGVNLRSANIGCSLSGGRPFLENVPAGGQTAGSSANCIINGRLAVFGEASTVYYPVVSARRVDSCTTDPVYGRLFCHFPTVLALDGSTTEVTYRNGAKVQGDSVGLIYLQDPNGTETKLLAFNPNKVPSAGDVYQLEPASLSNGDVAQPSPTATYPLASSICLGLSGRTAQLQYNSNSLQPKVTFEGC